VHPFSTKKKKHQEKLNFPGKEAATTRLSNFLGFVFTVRKQDWTLFVLVSLIKRFCPKNLGVKSLRSYNFWKKTSIGYLVDQLSAFFFFVFLGHIEQKARVTKSLEELHLWDRKGTQEEQQVDEDGHAFILRNEVVDWAEAPKIEKEHLLYCHTENYVDTVRFTRFSFFVWWRS
jgi:hypothetical protein